VLGWLDDALTHAAEEVDAELAEALAAVAVGARWRQTASYVEHPPDASFLDRYGHCSLAGTDDLTVGLLLLGSDVHDPRHHHPAEEFYLPRGDDPLDARHGRRAGPRTGRGRGPPRVVAAPRPVDRRAPGPPRLRLDRRRTHPRGVLLAGVTVPTAG
jgi:hypothetical protein